MSKKEQKAALTVLEGGAPEQAATQEQADTQEKTDLRDGVRYLSGLETVNALWFNLCKDIILQGVDVVFVPCEVPDDKLNDVGFLVSNTGYSLSDDKKMLHLLFPANGHVDPTVLALSSYATYLQQVEKMAPQTAYIVAMSSFLAAGLLHPLSLFRQRELSLPNGVVSIEIVDDEKHNDDFVAGKVRATTTPPEFLSRFIKEYESQLPTKSFSAPQVMKMFMENRLLFNCI